MEENNDYNQYVTTPEELNQILQGHFDPSQKISILNIGSKKGIEKSYHWLTKLTEKAEVFGLEYDLNFVHSQDPHSLFGDICNCPEIAKDSFDVIYIVNVLEHVKEPFKAAEECIRICKPNGVILVGAPFSWHYHKHPVDFWRFTPDALQYMFEKTGEVITLKQGFKHYCWFQKRDGKKPTSVESLYLGKKKS